MKATIERRALAAALKTVLPAIAKSGVQPILTGVHVEATDGGLRFQCSDLELTIATSAPAEVGEPGVIIVPATLLTKIVGTFDGTNVNLALDDDRLVIQSGGARRRLRLLAVENWPRNAEPEATPIDLDAHQAALVGRCLFAMSVDAAKPAWRGLRLEGGYAYASDGYRLVRADLGDVDLTGATIPSRAISAVYADHSDDSGLTVAIDDRSASFTRGDTTWTTRLIGSEYPSTKQMDGHLRPTSPRHLTVEGDTLAEAVNRAAVFAEEQSGAVWLTVINEVEIDVSSTQLDAGDGNEEIGCATDLETGFVLKCNHRFLGELVDAHGPGEFTLELVDSKSPAIVHADGLAFLQMLIAVNPDKA